MIALASGLDMDLWSTLNRSSEDDWPNNEIGKYA